MVPYGGDESIEVAMSDEYTEHKSMSNLADNGTKRVARCPESTMKTKSIKLQVICKS